MYIEPKARHWKILKEYEKEGKIHHLSISNFGFFTKKKKEGR